MNSSSNTPKRSPSVIAHRAVAALFRRQLIDGLGRWMVWTLCVSVIVIGVSKLIGWAMGSRWWWGWIILAGVWALLASLGSALRSRLSDAQGGGLLDARLGLKSQIRSAIELGEDQSSKERSPGFVALAQAQGERAAARVEINEAMPAININNWWRSAGVFALAIGVGIWMPMRGAGGAANQRVVPDQAIASIASVKEAVKESIADQPTTDSPAVQEVLDDLQSLEDELAKGVDDPSQANAQAAAKLEELAKVLDDESERTQAQASELADRIAEAQNRQQDRGADERGWDQQLNDFADAIKEQDYDQAQQQLDELREQADQMSDAQREQLADQLEQLADAVEPDSLEDVRPQAQPDDDLPDSLRDEAEDLRSSPEQTNEPDTTPDPDQEPQQEESTPPDEPESSKDQEKSSEQGQKQSEPQNTGQKKSEPPSGDQDQPQSGSETDQRKAQKEDGEAKDQPGDESTKPTEADQQKEQQSEQDDQRSTNGEQRQASKPEESPSEDASEQDQKQSREEQQQDQQTSEKQNQDQQSKPSDQDSKDGSDQQSKQQREGRSLDKALEKMKERQAQAKRNQDQAEKIRKQARKLIDPDQSPNQDDKQPAGVRREEHTQDNQGTGGDEPRDENEHPLNDRADTNQEFVPVDASGGGQSKDTQPVGKWYAPDAQTADKQGATETANRFKEASRKAQRALDQQQIPRKYRQVVAEVFKRVKQRGDAIESGSTVAPQGKDATSKKPPKKAPKKSGDEK